MLFRYIADINSPARRLHQMWCAALMLLAGLCANALAEERRSMLPSQSAFGGTSMYPARGAAAHQGAPRVSTGGPTRVPQSDGNPGIAIMGERNELSVLPQSRGAGASGVLR